MKLSEMLKKVLRERKLTPSQLSRATGVSTATLHGWQNGRAVQDLDALKKVAEVLQTPVHVLLYGEPDPFEQNDQSFEHLFTGDVRISIHKILSKKTTK